MIREIIIDIREGDEKVRRRLLGAILREIHVMAIENDPSAENFTAELSNYKLPKFPGKVVINVFDENEELMEVIET